MPETLNVELNKHQRDLLLEGLRYIRSTRRLAFRDPLAAPDAQRESELREIAGLMGQLDSGAEVPARVEG